MKRTKMEKGITLVALIITIVLLLILAVVAISAIQNDGIISHAENATGKYNQAVGNEQTTLNGYEDFLTGRKRNEYGFYLNEIYEFVDDDSGDIVRMIFLENGDALLFLESEDRSQRHAELCDVNYLEDKKAVVYSAGTIGTEITVEMSNNGIDFIASLNNIIVLEGEIKSDKIRGVYYGAEYRATYDAETEIKLVINENRTGIYTGLEYFRFYCCISFGGG